MKAIKTIAIGAAGVAALVGTAAPASAQIFPGYGQYGYSTNVIGQVLQSILNPYGNFGYNRVAAANPQTAVNQCANAVQQRLSYQNRASYSPYGYGYNTGGYGNAQILGITRVEQRSATTLRVRGYASSGASAYNGYGAYGYGAYGANAYGYAQPRADLSFKCDIDYRGYIRDIDINRR
ncbi:hypothetical protein H8M03_10880 [Sphingomonas sabuli]|uniref:Uncharacterized protein n=1 Tax=Sphingomonas sabuli TaxID=2764186 RepID=A0A7G9L1J9_9SPHN|nr:hypothetical protein [Sphingomonas sabuli]QNM82498.1 hypothetical protein H8M03_10880 [Sphingomonas sabuli]